MSSFKFGARDALLGYFWVAVLKISFIIEISNFEFVKLQQRFLQNKKVKSLGPKMPYVSIFGL